MSGAASNPVPGGISIRGLRKHYGSTVALNGLDLDIRPGEVLGVAGPNGAGKSTLIRVIAGEEAADAGELIFDGAPWSPTVDWHAVAVVHQEPQLFPNLTVAQNVMVGREPGKLLKPNLPQADAAVMAALGLGDFADRLLEDCSLATQQRTEIARAVARDSRVFLFDEPNSALTQDESDELFHQMHEIAKAGRLVMLVTHRLGDLVAHTDRVAVVRDGAVRTVLEGEALTEDGLARQLVVDSGTAVGPDDTRRATATSDGRPIFSVRDWSHGTDFEGITLDGNAGEIIALMGVEGSGARELLRSLAGLERATGNIEVDGVRGEAAMRGLTAYVPATRQHSLYTNYSVGDNLLVRLGYPEIAGPGLMLRRRAMQELAADAARRFLVKTRTITQGIRSLSGGNQQKVAIAQALNCAPRLLLLEEPTRGVDIHSKAEIYRLLRDYADAGHTVVIFCTEVLEIFEAADRAYVVSDGALSGSLQVADYAQVEQLATAVSGLERAGRARQPFAA